MSNILPIIVATSILFWEEISASAAVHTCYVMDRWDRVQSIILLLHTHMVGTSFLLFLLRRLNASDQALTSHFWGEKQSNTAVLNHNIFNSFLLDLWLCYIWKIGNICLLLKDNLRKRFLSYQICSFDEESKTYWGLMDNKRNMFLLNIFVFGLVHAHICYCSHILFCILEEKSWNITFTKFKEILN